MTRNVTGRRGALVALAAGATWCVVSLLSIAEQEPVDYLDVLVVIPFSLTLFAFLGIHRRQRDRLGQLGQAAYWISVVGMAAALAGQAGIVAGVDELEWLSFPVGALGWFGGFALYGIATARTKALPAWIGAALALSEPLTIVAALALSPIVPLADHGNFSGAIAHGLVWLAIGRALTSRAIEQVDASATRTARGIA